MLYCVVLLDVVQVVYAKMLQDGDDGEEARGVEERLAWNFIDEFKAMSTHLRRRRLCSRADKLPFPSYRHTLLIPPIVGVVLTPVCTPLKDHDVQKRLGWVGRAPWRRRRARTVGAAKPNREWGSWRVGRCGAGDRREANERFDGDPHWGGIHLHIQRRSTK